MIEVTFSVLARLLEDDKDGVRAGYYADLDEGLRHGLLESWRHHQGSYHTVRLDLLSRDDKRPDDAQAEAPETGEPEAGEAAETRVAPEDGPAGSRPAALARTCLHQCLRRVSGGHSRDNAVDRHVRNFRRLVCQGCRPHCNGDMNENSDPAQPCDLPAQRPWRIAP